MSAQITIDVPVTEMDPFSEECADPYPFHKQLRDAGPVFKLKRYGIYGMARYRQVHAALNDWQTFISGAGAGIQNLRNPPLHDQTRGTMARVLSGPAVRKLRKFEIEAERLVEDLVSI